MGGSTSQQRRTREQNTTPKPRAAKIIFSGLHGAGKTTSIQQAQRGEAIATPVTTIGVDFVIKVHNNLKLRLWDTSGRGYVRVVLRSHIRGTDAFVFLVDSNATDRFQEAKDYLHETISNDELKECPVLILANKQDLPGSASVQRISEEMEFHKIQQTKCIMPVCAMTGDGFKSALDWLEIQIADRYTVENLLISPKDPGIQSLPTNTKTPKTKNREQKLDISTDIKDEGVLSARFVHNLWTKFKRAVTIHG